jgi:hypothetical protein
VLFALAERAALEGDLRSLPLFAVIALFFLPPTLPTFTCCCFSSILGFRVISVRGNEKLGFSLINSWFAAAFLVLFSECTVGVLPSSFAFCLFGSVPCTMF